VIIISIVHNNCSITNTSLIGCIPAGGGILTITGSRFYGANPTTISVLNGICGALTINAGFTQITCPLQAMAAGTRLNVTVVGNGGSSGTGVFTIQYALPPTLASIYHSSCSVVGTALVGCPGGGGNLTITGTNFYGANPSNIVVSPTVCSGAFIIDTNFTKIICLLKPNAGTTQNIFITTNGGTTVAVGRNISFGNYMILLIAFLSLYSVLPLCLFVVLLIVCSYSIAVLPQLTAINHPDCSPVGLRIVGCPGNGGNLLTMTGVNLYGDVSTITITPAVCIGPISQNTPLFTKLTCVLNIGTGTTANIVILTNGGVTNAIGRNISYGNNYLNSLHYFFYRLITFILFILLYIFIIVGLIPVITGIDHPNCSSVGTNLVGCPPGGGNLFTIVGYNFYGGIVNVTGGVCGSLTINDIFTIITCPFQSRTAGSISNVTVYSNGGNSMIGMFTVQYASPPTLTTIAHIACSSVGNTLVGCPPTGGNILTLTGTNFYGANPGTVSITPSSIVVDYLSINFEFTEITFILGAGIGITSDILVRTNGGTTTAIGYTIQYASQPILQSLSHPLCIGNHILTACPYIGGNIITFIGANFYGALFTISITPSIICADQFIVDSSFTQITCTLSAQSVGNVFTDIVITTNGGNSPIVSQLIIGYGFVPLVQQLHYSNSDNSGTDTLTMVDTRGGGDLLTIVGANFDDTITVDSLSCNGSIVLVDPSVITCKLASNAPSSTIWVYVTTASGGTSAQSVSFTVGNIFKFISFALFDVSFIQFFFYVVVIVIISPTSNYHLNL
jgi:hypothetical protein